MAQRLKDLLTARGYTQARLEKEIGASQGYLSRIVKGERGQKISPEYLTSIASVLQVTPNFLRWGAELDEGAIMTPAAGLSPKLEEIEGYREAEYEVIRKNPDVPFSVFESARLARMSPPPERIDEEYLGGLVSFLASTRATVSDSDVARETTRTKSVRR